MRHRPYFTAFLLLSSFFFQFFSCISIFKSYSKCYSLYTIFQPVNEKISAKMSNKTEEEINKLLAELPGQRIPDTAEPLGNYSIVQTLGEGAFGEVQLIVNKEKPKIALAVKKISLYGVDQQKINVISKEFLMQKRCSRKDGSDNVIKVIACKYTTHWCYMFLEYADGGELFDKIEPDVGMPAAYAQFYFRQLISGLRYIHHMDIVHRDIKPENLLLTNTRKQILKYSHLFEHLYYRCSQNFGFWDGHPLQKQRNGADAGCELRDRSVCSARSGRRTKISRTTHRHLVGWNCPDCYAHRRTSMG